MWFTNDTEDVTCYEVELTCSMNVVHKWLWRCYMLQSTINMPHDCGSPVVMMLLGPQVLREEHDKVYRHHHRNQTRLLPQEASEVSNSNVCLLLLVILHATPPPTNFSQVCVVWLNPVELRECVQFCMSFYEICLWCGDCKELNFF